MSRSYIDCLVDDCLELIFKQLREDHNDISSVSLVCKRFLTITNGIKTSLYVKELSSDQFARLLQRYSNLKSIEIEKQSRYEVVVFIRQILSSGLELEYLRIPFEEISCGNDLRGMGMSMKSLKTLYLTLRLSPWGDDDLIGLTNLFPCIEDLKIVESLSVTDHGIAVLATKLKRLVKITLINCQEITDQSLKSLSSNGLNFTEITITDCPKLTENGVGFLLSHSCSMLTSLNLNCNSKWTNVTFYTLTKRCPMLETIRMNCTSVGTSEGLVLGSHKNLRMKTLSLCWNEVMDDKTLISFCSICPNLESLYLGDCPLLTDAGISEIVRICSKLRFLKVSYLNVSNFLGASNEVSLLKLKIIDASETKICDAGMKSIGMRCPYLEILIIGGCKNVTRDGVEEVVKNCKNIKKINMWDCQFVSKELMDWIVKTRPSLHINTDSWSL